MGFAPAPGRWRVALGLAACAALVVAGVASLARRQPLVAASASGSTKNDAALAAAALWRLRTTPAWAGRLRYGAAFLPYEAFVEAHADDLAALKCGDASIHASGPLFFAYHRLLRREFLAAFRAVAPRGLGDVPPRPPGGHGAWDGVLGPLTGDADRGYAVGDGAFAGWPVAWRGVTHDTPAKRAMPPVLVRYDAYCGERSRGLDAAAGDAFAAFRNATDWAAAAERALRAHVLVHRAFGGARGCNRTDHVVGDFDNAKASVNDPAFFAVHAAFDAALDGWLAARDAPAAAARRAAVDLARALRPCAAALADHRFAATLLDEDAATALFLGTDVVTS